MKALGRVWWMSFGALLAFVFILFAIHNHTPVVVDLAMRRYLVEVWALVMIALAVGLTVPAVFMIGQRLASSRRERALQHRVNDLERELRALRNVSVNEPLPGEPPVAMTEGKSAPGAGARPALAAAPRGGTLPSSPGKAGAGAVAPVVADEADTDLAGA